MSLSAKYVNMIIPDISILFLKSIHSKKEGESRGLFLRGAPSDLPPECIANQERNDIPSI